MAGGVLCLLSTDLKTLDLQGLPDPVGVCEIGALRASRPGDIEQARRLLDQALAAGVELGLPIVERQARRVMELLP